MTPIKFQQALLRWFDQYGRHDLPWQKKPTPYRVWVSEIMLQQTQVSTVIPYFQKFMQRFPTVKSLALADSDEVLAHWSGLGYYARARHLHCSAKMIYHNHRGRFPDTCEALVQLPGIGLSTAGAILSLGFQQSATILDGNVKRVLARYHAINSPLNQTNALKDLWQLATKYTPNIRCNDYNQAMMDLGATLCTRTKPQCIRCPLQKSCQAYLQGTPMNYPAKIKKAAIPTKSTYMLLLRNKSGELLLEKRPSNGIWGGLWSFPECATESDILKYGKTQLNAQTTKPVHWSILNHQFTHFNLEIKPVLLQVKQISHQKNGTHLWYSFKNKLPGGVPTPVLKLLKILNKEPQP